MKIKNRVMKHKYKILDKYLFKYFKKNILKLIQLLNKLNNFTILLEIINFFIINFRIFNKIN